MFGKINIYILLVTVTILLSFMTGCSRDKQDQQTSEIKRPTPPEVTTIKGKVIEAVEAGSFLYVLLDLGEQQTWAAVPPVDVEIGEDVTLRNANYFNNFYSKSLQKSFDKMIFSSGIEGKEPRRREASLDGQGSPVNRRSRMMPSPTAKTRIQSNTSTDSSPAKEK